MGDRNNSYQDFLNDLHQKDGDADDCRYGVYDYDYQFNPDGAEATFKSKIFLMSWCPDSSKIKKKMLYSSSFDTLKRGEYLKMSFGNKIGEINQYHFQHLWVFTRWCRLMTKVNVSR